jgi:serine/threonine protein kinase
MPEDDKSLGDQPTFSGGSQPLDESSQSLGDEHTFSGGVQNSPQSLGDEATFGDASGGDDAVFDDGMEVVDLSARYTIEGTLGKGGMGEVLLATDTRLNRKVAIKRIHGDAAKSRTAVSRFLTEAQSIAALNHPNIVQIYDYGRAADGPFLIMEYVEGRSLLDKCREGAIPLEDAVELMCQLCDGLGTAHEANIIKSGNLSILISNAVHGVWFV